MSLKSKLFILVSLFFSGLSAHASCGSFSCPVDTRSPVNLKKGEVRLDASYEYVEQDEPQIGREDASVGEIPGHHDEIYTLTTVRRLGLEASVSNRLSLQASVPFMQVEHQHVHHHHGTDILDTWNFEGVGDMTALGHYSVLNGRTKFVATAGGVLPTGREHAVNDSGSEAEVGILPGKGAYSLIIGGTINRTFSARTANSLYGQMPLFFSTTYQWNEPGTENYKMGNTWLANIGTIYPVFPKLGIGLQSNLRVAAQDDRGDTREEVEKTGGTFVYLSPGVELGLAEGLNAFIYLQIPVYERVNSIQLTSGTNLTSGLSYRFSAL